MADGRLWPLSDALRTRYARCEPLLAKERHPDLSGSRNVPYSHRRNVERPRFHTAKRTPQSFFQFGYSLRCSMTGPTTTLAEINRRNREFWEGPHVLRERRMANEAIRETAFETINSETMRQVPVRNRKSFESTLEDAERAQRRFCSQMARAGGRAEKLDALGRLILDIVRSDQNISLVQLLMELKEKHIPGPVIDVGPLWKELSHATNLGVHERLSVHSARLRLLDAARAALMVHHSRRIGRTFSRPGRPVASW
jgi:hypothetical protein